MSPVGWTIFTFGDLVVGLLLLDLMATTIPPEKLPRLRKMRIAVIALLAISGIVLAAQLAHHYGWIKY